MTSTSVKDLSSIMTFVNPSAQTKAKGFAQDTGFGDVMTKAESNQTNVDVGSAEKHKTEADSFTQHVERTNSKGTKIENAKPEETVDETEAMESLNEAGEKIVKQIADEMNVDEEEVRAAMESLGISPIELLDSSVLGDLVLEISDESDPMALLTSESLFESVKNLTTVVDATMADLAQDMDIEVVSLKDLIENADIQKAANEDMEMSVETNLDSSKIQKDSPKIIVNNEKSQEVPNENDGAKVDMIENDNAEDLKVNTATNDNPGSDNLNRDLNRREVNHQISRDENSKDNSISENSNSFREAIHAGSEVKNPILNNLTNDIVQSSGPVESYFSEETRNIMDQIMDHMKVNLKPDMDQIELQLHPASLGSVKVNLTATKGGEVTAEFKVQNEQVKAAVEAQLNDLRETFKATGTKVTAIEVQVEMQSFDSNLWQGKGHNSEADARNNQSKRQRRINIDDLDALFEDEASDEEKLTAQMMKANGNTVDYMA